MAAETATPPIRPIDLGKSTAWNAVGLGTPVLLALLCIPALVRNLGVERFGLLSILWTVVGYAGLFDLGLGRALNLEVSRCIGQSRPTELRHTVRTGLLSLALIGLLFGACCVLCAPAIAAQVKASAAVHAELVTSLRLLGLAIPVAVLSGGMTGTLEAMGRFELSNVSRMAVALVTFAGSALISFRAQSLVVAAATLLAARCIAMLLVAGFVRNVTVSFAAPRGVTRRDIRRFVHAGRWLMATNILTPALAYGDRLVLTFTIPAALLAFYTVPYELVTKVLIAASAVSNSLFPAVSRHAHEIVALKRLLRRSVFMVTAVVCPALLVGALIARPGLAWWVNADFAEHAYHVLQILCAGVLCNALGAIAYATLQGLNRAHLIVGLLLVETPFYLVALLLAAPVGGLAAVAAVWSARMALDAGAQWYLVLRAIRQDSHPAEQLRVGPTA